MAKNATLISTTSTAHWWLEWRCTAHALNDKGERPPIKAAIKVVEQRIAALACFEGAYFEASVTHHHEALEVLQLALNAPEPPKPKPDPATSVLEPTPQKPRQLALSLFDFSG